MSNDELKIRGPIEVESDAPSRVAYDLMLKIAGMEGDLPERRERKYWLTLFHQCRMAMEPEYSLKSILRDDRGT